MVLCPDDGWADAIPANVAARRSDLGHAAAGLAMAERLGARDGDVLLEAMVRHRTVSELLADRSAGGEPSPDS